MIRPSGTEPLVRVMIEGENQEYITKKAREVVDLIEENKIVQREKIEYEITFIGLY